MYIIPQSCRECERERADALARRLALTLQNLHDNDLIDASELLADPAVQALL